MKATGASQFTKAFRDASKSVQGIDKSTSGASVSIGKMLTAVAGVAAAVGVGALLMAPFHDLTL